MPRIRSVHPDICQSETMARLPAELERTFVRLWTHCDDDGRCEDRPKILKAFLYPEHDDITAISLDEELTRLEQVGLIQRYAVEGKRLIQVVSWSEYQKPQKPRPSKYAPPTGYVQDPDDSPPEEDAAGVGVGEGDVVGEEPLAQAPHKRDLLFEAVIEVCRINPGELTDSARGAVNKALKSLREIRASPAAVRDRAGNWASVYPDTTLTPTALAKHWPMLATARAPTPRRDRYVEMGRSLQDRMNRVGEEGANGQPSGIADEARRSLPEG